MHFVAILKHTPDNCWGHEEKQEMAREWIGSIDDRAEEHDVELHGSFANSNEHTFFFLLEAETYQAVSGFFGPPLLQDHDADIVPVLPFDDVVDAVLDE